MQRERMTELELTRERNAIKARIKRTRDELDPDRPRRQTRRAASKRAADYGLISIFASDHPDTIECGVCGRRMGAHGRDVCDECEQRLETRAARR